MCQGMNNYELLLNNPIHSYDQKHIDIAKLLTPQRVWTFLNMQGKSSSVIFEEMFSVYQEECLSYETVKNWVRKFKSVYPR